MMLIIFCPVLIWNEYTIKGSLGLPTVEVITKDSSVRNKLRLLKHIHHSRVEHSSGYPQWKDNWHKNEKPVIIYLSFQTSMTFSCVEQKIIKKHLTDFFSSFIQNITEYKHTCRLADFNLYELNFGLYSNQLSKYSHSPELKASFLAQHVCIEKKWDLSEITRSCFSFL